MRETTRRRLEAELARKRAEAEDAELAEQYRAAQQQQDQVAFAALKTMPARDRQLVERWRMAGYSLTDAVLNSGVLRAPGTSRVTPESYETVRRTAEVADAYDEALADKYRVFGPEERLAQTAEHEAAHAVVAAALGCRNVRATIRLDGTADADGELGRTTHSGGVDDATRATVAVSSEVWLTSFRAGMYPDGGTCRDRRQAAELLGDAFNVSIAKRAAWRVLAERRDAVHTIAHTLLAQGSAKL